MGVDYEHVEDAFRMTSHAVDEAFWLLVETSNTELNPNSQGSSTQTVRTCPPPPLSRTSASHSDLEPSAVDKAMNRKPERA